MKHLLSPEGEAALTAIVKRRPLLAFDFDGTLAPIVARPDDAKVPMPVARRLKALSASLHIAIISGRCVSDVLDRLHFEPTYVIGNHGAEDPAFPLLDTHFHAMDGLRTRLHGLRDVWQQLGVTLEDKGASLALHYRLARDRSAAADAITEALVDLNPGLMSFGGKCVVNVVAKSANDKAQALASLVERSQAVCAVFVGDDVNDEPVFARGEANWLTVRVGRDDPSSQAQYFLDSVSDLPAMLELMQVALMSAE
ncbi:MAG TPA: trehalose-phosphatase [Aquabacterium sp.]|uniref:trehalose-phosphatase n=1 Tax=Aquabacterium sp. TaxID=1872578 RepID=UPI002E30460C|nr:trehalose-phosphatase [Aquabacterium sp.]HEX5356759.1 trehalose-phosphatase [Aquabacterium sp.]